MLLQSGLGTITRLTPFRLQTPASINSMLSSRVPVHISLTRSSKYLFIVTASYSSNPSGAAKDEFAGRVGFLGLGIMGSPMAQNLIKAGCHVTVWNRTQSKCDQFMDLGAKYKSTPAEVASSCDVTLAMLADPESAIDVACGTNGAVAGMCPGKGQTSYITFTVHSALQEILSNIASFL